MTIPIIKVLREARGIAVDEAVAAQRFGDLKRKADWQRRREYIERHMAEFDIAAGAATGKSVFISYSKASGATYFKYVQHLLEGRGFEVVTGFQAYKDSKGNVIRQILGQLGRSALYVGILTPEIEIRLETGEKRWSPGVWIMEEKGMALALRKPFVLMVDDRIHVDYWQKTTPAHLHQMFSPDTYMTAAAAVVETVEDRYAEIAEAHNVSLGPGGTPE